MLEPAAHMAGAIVALWRAIGGRIEGAVREGVVPRGARRIHVQSSAQLEEVIRVVNKRSNNLMARTLFLTLGAKREGAPGTLPKARKAVGDWLVESGLDFPDLVLDNGSGLSRDTRISAESMGRLLGYAYASPNMPEFLSSLAIAGMDGTMRKRFRKSDLKGHAHVKTGTIRGTTGIVGYVLDRHGERWIVVSLMNNPRLQAWRGKGVENTLLRWVYEKAGDYEGASAVSAPKQDHQPQSPNLQANATPTDWFLSPGAPTR
jgi:D-alanyl-D-alanine carboxypeptidase/D-alanyl-D-alanine-endopeptidase (penicillin-binding protein 4)